MCSSIGDGEPPFLEPSPSWEIFKSRSRQKESWGIFKSRSRQKKVGEYLNLDLGKKSWGIFKSRSRQKTSWEIFESIDLGNV